MKPGNKHYHKDMHNPQFKWQFLAPKHWAGWILIFLFVILSFLPNFIRYWLGKQFAKIAMSSLNKKNNMRARINLRLCFPEKSQDEREKILHDSYVVAACYLMMMSALSIRSKSYLEKHTEFKNLDNLTQLTEAGENVIMLVPHTWAIDAPGVILASRGLFISAMAKEQKDELMDWLMNRQRYRFGGRVYERSGGIKPFIKSVRDGYLGYYLPDEDLGPDHSVFVDFFATTKATMSGLGRISKLSKAKIVPLFAGFNPKTGCFEFEFKPELPFPTGSEEGDARTMNQCIEDYVNVRPEQYMWILRLLKTQKDLRINLYRYEQEKLTIKNEEK